MCKRIFALLALTFGLFGTQCWAATCTPTEEGMSCTNTFSPANTTNTYDFTGSGDGVVVVQFATVLTTFDLTVTFTHTIDPFDPTEFPAGTICVPYSSNGGRCDQYNFTGTSGGPNGVPVKNTDYQGLITLTLSYSYFGTVHDPAFAHAPGDITTFTENILTSYSSATSCGLFGCEDPTMGGTVPGLSSIAALDEPLTGNNTFCSLTTSMTNNPSGQKPEIEVTLTEASGACSGGTGVRDKTASLSVSTTDSNRNVIFPALKNVEANKFHWDNKNGVNEYDISTDGLVSGQTYTVTVFSSLISVQSTTFVAP
ncbi:MAG TPA: hypothetical protein VK788_07820 [Terriglobales bacterium]|jgi:hypothetical protein|nr:hypothetical protein [Terriglobales bacterium]